MHRPDYLVQGKAARLFPVLATTSKESRTTSIVPACISKIEEFGSELVYTVGKRTKIEAYTEIVFKIEKVQVKNRPDGLIVVRTGSNEWRALVEAKVGNAEIGAEQVEKYRDIAKEQGLDCVITISNHFATQPEYHPVEDVRQSRSKIPVFHWSWVSILTVTDILLNQDSVANEDQELLLNELRRFLTHESAGAKGFDRMFAEWLRSPGWCLLVGKSQPNLTRRRLFWNHGIKKPATYPMYSAVKPKPQYRKSCQGSIAQTPHNVGRTNCRPFAKTDS